MYPLGEGAERLGACVTAGGDVPASEPKQGGSKKLASLWESRADSPVTKLTGPVTPPSAVIDSVSKRHWEVCIIRDVTSDRCYRMRKYRCHAVSRNVSTREREGRSLACATCDACALYCEADQQALNFPMVPLPSLYCLLQNGNSE